MKRISTVSLTVVAVALVVVAKPSHSIIAALLHGQSGSGLYVRSGIDPTSIASQCQPNCTPVIQKLDACRSASCECTQANLDALAVCINCLVPLGPQNLNSDGLIYTDLFQDYCGAQNIMLNPVSITATPTGTATTGDPLSMFEAPTPTSGATAAVTVELPPLIPSYSGSVQAPGQAKSKIGSAIGLNAFRALGTSVLVAAAAAIVILGVSSF